MREIDKQFHSSLQQSCVYVKYILILHTTAVAMCTCSTAYTYIDIRLIITYKGNEDNFCFVDKYQNPSQLVNLDSSLILI